MCRGVGGSRWRRTGGGQLVVVLLVCVVLVSSAAMASGARTGPAVAGGTGSAVPGLAVVTSRGDATGAITTTRTAPPVATTTAASAATYAADPYKDSKRKVPNGPDPIHNRRARWGDAPAKRAL